MPKNGYQHVFLLEADATLNPEERHHNKVRIREFRTLDGEKFEDLGIALMPSESEEDWDSLSLWTGSALSWQGADYLFYTGRRRREFWHQRIGLAVRSHQGSFQREPDFLLEPDGEIYCSDPEKNSLGVAPAFRDPFVYFQGGSWQMVFAARDAGKPGPYNACIGRATSPDLRNWKLQRPLLSPGIYGQMECPQMYLTDRGYLLVFSLFEGDLAPELGFRKAGLYAWESFEGVAFRPVSPKGLLNEEGNRVYAQRLIFHRGKLFVSGFANEVRGQFVGGMQPWMEWDSHPFEGLSPFQKPS